MRIEQTLEQIARRAIRVATGEDSPALLRPTSDSRHGDYQINAAMALAKRLKKNPRELAELIASELRHEPTISHVEIAGPGFVNLTLSSAWLAEQLSHAALDHERDGVPLVERPLKVVIDFSSPNIAKQMHVGHLRSTIIGDALCKLSRFVGHQVVGDNHIGDWGTQYGLLIAGMAEMGNASALEDSPIEELERVYQAASKRAKEDEVFAERARKELSKLQLGDSTNLAMWRKFVATTRKALDSIYERMNVQFDQWLGESAFNDALPGVVRELIDKNIARPDQGAVGIFWQELAAAPASLKKQEQPFLIQKRDGAFLYSTTDIAAAQFRKEKWRAERCLYVVDARQALHFTQLFAVISLLGIDMEMEHISFGTVLDEAGKPLKTRDGKAVTLASLLDEAESRAQIRLREGIEEGKVQIAEDQIATVARAVGIGAVKYSDLRQNRASDYQFDWDKLVSFQGNAGPYLQYAYARICSVFEKADRRVAETAHLIHLGTAEEERLARVLICFGEVVHKAAESNLPHLLTDHLYELAKAFMAFFEACPILKAEAEMQTSRLTLAAITARQIRRGLGLLGIDVVERM
jgi:arginyl-tRNA synthetase